MLAQTLEDLRGGYNRGSSADDFVEGEAGSADLKRFTERVRPFILVTARDRGRIREKLYELDALNIPFLIICGERVDHPKVRYRKVRGKWDAINFGSQFTPPDAKFIVLNDCDTEIHNLEHAFTHARHADLIYCLVKVTSGPQTKFYEILNPIRKRLNVAASGELMLIKRSLFNRLIPIPPCNAEDTYMMFKALEWGNRVRFCTQTYVITERTLDPAEEQVYKRRTTLGIYHALRLAKPPPAIRAFYYSLPLIFPLLAIGGGDGRAWTIGIEQAIVSGLMKRFSTSFPASNKKYESVAKT